MSKYEPGFYRATYSISGGSVRYWFRVTGPDPTAGYSAVHYLVTRPRSLANGWTGGGAISDDDERWILTPKTPPKSILLSYTKWLIAEAAK